MLLSPPPTACIGSLPHPCVRVLISDAIVVAIPPVRAAGYERALINPRAIIAIVIWIAIPTIIIAPIPTAVTPEITPPEDLASAKIAIGKPVNAGAPTSETSHSNTRTADAPRKAVTAGTMSGTAGVSLGESTCHSQ